MLAVENTKIPTGQPATNEPSQRTPPKCTTPIPSGIPPTGAGHEPQRPSSLHQVATAQVNKSAASEQQPPQSCGLDSMGQPAHSSSDMGSWSMPGTTMADEININSTAAALATASVNTEMIMQSTVGSLPSLQNQTYPYETMSSMQQYYGYAGWYPPAYSNAAQETISFT